MDLDELLEQLIILVEDRETQLTGLEPWYDRWTLFRNHLTVARDYLDDVVDA